MTIEEIIKSRRSVFTNQFSGERIPRQQIEEFLELANWAPNHLHTEPWRFQVYSGNGLKDLMGHLAELYKKHTPKEKVSQAKMDKYAKRVDWVSHAIVINVHYDEKGRVPRIEESNAVACAVQNLWLAITQTKDIRGYWSTGSLVYTDDLAFWLGLQDNEKCMGIFYLGKLKKDAIQAHSTRGDVSEKTTWID